MATITVTPTQTFVSGNTVTPATLNQLAQSTVALTAGSIVAADIASDAVTTAKILDANVTNAKIASGVDASKLTTGTLPADRIGSSAITTARINDAAVTAAKLDGAQTGSAPIYGCRAWVNFDGTSVTDVDGEDRCTINSSGNVSKVVRTSTGLFVVHFTTAMASTSYAVVCGSTSNDNADDSLRENESAAKTTTSVALRATRNSAASDAASNPVSGSVIIFA